MTRKEAREFAMQTLFQIDAQKDWCVENLEEYVEKMNFSDKKLKVQKDYVVQLMKTICENIEKIDEFIDSVSDNWSTKRMSKIDLNIIRLSVGEILFMETIPTAVSINEAVNLAKKYGTDHSPAFVNSILGKIDERETETISL